MHNKQKVVMSHEVHIISHSHSISVRSVEAGNRCKTWSIVECRREKRLQNPTHKIACEWRRIGGLFAICGWGFWPTTQHPGGVVGNIISAHRCLFVFFDSLYNLAPSIWFDDYYRLPVLAVLIHACCTLQVLRIKRSLELFDLTSRARRHLVTATT